MKATTIPRETAPARSVRPKMQSLQQAASVVFALVSVLPLLAFSYSLYTLGALGRWEHQIRLGVALSVSLLGFYIFKKILARISDLLQTAAHVVPRAPASTTASEKDLHVPGIGAISEIGEMADLVNYLWKAEAERHVGSRVAVSVLDAPAALTGSLVRLTGEGAVLEMDGAPTVVAYRRITAIEADPRAP